MRKNNKNYRISQTGISLLEVLAALVILSMGATVAFTWFNQNVSVLNRIKQEEKILLIKTEAIEYIKSINPRLNPEGSKEILGYSVKWESTIKSNPQRALNNQGGEGRFEVSLYEINAKILSLDEKETYENIKLNSAGYSEVAGNGMAW